MSNPKDISSPQQLWAHAGILITGVLFSLIVRATCVDSWQDRFGTGLDDQIRAAIRDDAGNVYIGGFEGGLIGVENSWPVGDSNGFVEKRAPDGARLWRYDFDTASADIVEALALDSQGRVVVAGRTSGAFPGQVNGGQFDLFIGVLDAIGHPLTVAQFGNERPQHPVAMSVLQSGDVMVAGFDDVFVLGSAVIDWENGFVARFQITAADVIVQKWWLQPNFVQSDMVTSIASASDDTFVSYIKSASPANGGGIHVERWDALGNPLWQKTVSTVTFDYISNVVVSNDGRLYVSGTTVAQVAGPPLGNSDGFVLELNPASGEFLNGAQFGTSGAEWIHSMSMDSSGVLYFTGVTNEGLVPGYQGDGTYVPFVLEFSADLSPLGTWQHNPPAQFADEAILPVPTGCNGAVLLAGSAILALPGLPEMGREDAQVLPVQPRDSIFVDDFEIH